jgi:thiol:disulfide interchange protein
MEDEYSCPLIILVLSTRGGSTVRMRHRSISLGLLYCAVLLQSALCVAEDAPTVAYSLKENTLTGAPGGTVNLEISGAIPAGYHTYTSKTFAEYGDETIPILPTSFAVEPAELIKLNGRPSYPKPKIVNDPILTDKPIETIEGTAAFTIPVKIADDAKPGDHEGILVINGQICKEQCYQIEKKLKFTLKVSGAGGGLSSLISSKFKKGGGGLGEKKNVEWSLKESTLSSARGQTMNVEVLGVIPEGFHVYSTKTGEEYGEDVALRPTTFKLEPAETLAQNGKVSFPPPHLVKNPIGGNAMIETFEKNVSFTVPVQISKDAKAGEISAKITVIAQMCDANNCIDAIATLPFTLKISDAAAVKEPAVARNTTPSSSGKGLGGKSDIDSARNSGLWSYLWLSMGAGALSLLTPCVFPMIPITVSFFTKRKQVSRARSIRDAFLYAVGIILTFVALGFLFTLLMGASGVQKFAANPLANLFIFAVFTALALSLFGAFEIQLPTGILNKLNAKANDGDGVGSVLMMGLVFSLTSFTCTVPFIGATLVSATQGDLLWPLVGMLGFSSVFAAPFFLLALVPAWLKSLPKSGGWLNSVKVVMGFLELAAALKFASNIDLAYRWGIITREVFISGWMALSLLATYYLLGRFQMTHDSPVERIGGFRAMLAAGFLTISVWLGSGLAGHQLGAIEAFLPDDPYPGTASKSSEKSGEASSEPKWLSDLESGFAEAKRTKKRIFVDFTGYLCVNCRLMEKKVFPTPEVAAQLREFVRVRLYTDGSGSEAEIDTRNRDYQNKRFSTVALPFYVILTPDDEFIDSFDGLTYDTQKFADFLKNGLTRAPVKK